MIVGSNDEYVAQSFEVMFRNGYSKNSEKIICKCKLKIEEGKEEWGAEKRKRILHIRNSRGVKLKTEKTKKLEELLEQKFNLRNEFYVFECTLGWYGSEIVDCVMYNCNREIYCYEIKQSVQDFHSKNKLSFFGNKNYFVMPYVLYEKVKNEIPPKIGVYVAIDHLEDREEETTNIFGIKNTRMWKQPIDGVKELYCIQNAHKMDLKADKEVILSSMLRSMQRDRINAIPREE